MRRRGMTMVELLTVVAVTGMLAVMAAPNLTGGRDRRATNTAARQAMMAFRLARSEAIRQQKNVAIQMDVDRNEIRVFVTRSASDFSMYNPRFHVTVRLLTARLRRGEDKKDWPNNVHLADASVIDGLAPLPEVYAGLDPKSCSFCTGGYVIFATPKGRFVDFGGRPIVGSFSVARQAYGGFQRVWLTRVVAFNGMTGSSKIYAWRGDEWR